MNTLIVSDSYPPEIRSASHLMQELAEELRNRGHRVTIATCFPRYNLAEGAQKENFPLLSMEDGIRVLRIKTLSHHKVNFMLRGISQLTLPGLFNMQLRARFKGDRFDAVIVYSPPLPLWRVGLWAKVSLGARFILNVQDIFPQNAIDLGALRNPLLIHYFRNMEKRAYQAADAITVHSASNRDFLLRNKVVDPAKLIILHNWVEIEPGRLKQTARAARYRRMWGLEGKFIFFFGGVIGPSQGLDLVIRAANELKEEKEIVFLLVGDGTEKPGLEKMTREYGLTNVFFKPFVSKSEYNDLLKEVDVGLVCLTSRNRTPVVPGKILGYMASGIPILALLNRESDGHAVIQDAKCGYSDTSDDPAKAVKLLMKMYQEKQILKDMGANGYAYASCHYAKRVCVDRLESLFTK